MRFDIRWTIVHQSLWGRQVHFKSFTSGVGTRQFRTGGRWWCRIGYTQGGHMSKNAIPKKPKVEMLPVDRIIPSTDNKRRSMSRASIHSLAESLKKRGMLQPIIVRPHPKERGHFEIRAGERRWRAAKAAKLTHVPAIIGSMDDW